MIDLPGICIKVCIINKAISYIPVLIVCYGEGHTSVLPHNHLSLGNCA